MFVQLLVRKAFNVVSIATPFILKERFKTATLQMVRIWKKRHGKISTTIQKCSKIYLTNSLCHENLMVHEQSNEIPDN